MLQTVRNMLAFALAVAFTNAALPSQGQSSWGDNQPAGVRESASTGMFTPGRSAFDGNVNTAWQLTPDSSSGWVERYWSSPQRIAGVAVTASIPQGVTMQFSALQNNEWVPIPGAAISGPQGGQITLTFPGYLPPTTRLLATLAGKGADQSQVWEIIPSTNSYPISYGKILPQSYTFNQNEYITIKPSRLWNGVIDDPWFTPLWSVPWEVTNTDAADQPTSIFPPFFGNPSQDPEIVWQLDNAYTIQTLKVYFLQNYQSIEFQFWDGAKWNNAQIFGAGWSDPGSGWKRIDLAAPVTTTKIRITFPGSWNRAAYIGQVEVWGQGWSGTPDQALTIPLADTDGSFHFTVNSVSTRDQELEVTVPGQTSTVLSGEWNGTAFTANPTTWIGGDTVYRIPFALSSFRTDTQFLKLNNPGALHSVVLGDGANHGQISLGWPYSDGQMSSTLAGPGQSVRALKINTWTFKVPYQLERLRVYTGNASPGTFQTLNHGHATNVNWTSEGQGWWEAVLSGIQADQLAFESPTPVTLDEVEVWGSPLADIQPDIEIWWPKGPVSSSSSDGNSVIGWMGNSSTQPLIGTWHPRQADHLFWMPLSAMSLSPGQAAQMTVEGSLGSANWSGPLALNWPGPSVPATLDQGTGLTSTTQGTFVVSGKVNNLGALVFVQGTAIPVNGNTFTTAVTLKDGFQILDIEVWDRHKQKELAQFSKPVYKTVGQPIIQTSLPAGDLYTQATSMTLTGLVGNGTGLALSVNGTSVPITNNAWTQTVALTGGLQKISFVLKDNAGRETDQTLTVNQVATAPTAQIQAPARGAYLASSQVTLQLMGSNPQYWWQLNGGPWTPAYTQTIDPVYSLADGFYTWTVSIQDREGNISAPAAVSFCVDTTPPLPFTIGSNVSGWTNNNQPTITFGTTDATSGVDHYEYVIDTGGFTTATSPLQLPALADGVHTIFVKAVDKAGNSTLETIALNIDATPPQAPTSLSAVPGETEIDLTWTPSLENGVLASLPLTYLVTRTPAWPDGVHTSQTPSYNDTGLTPGISYSYSVMEMDVAGNISPATASVSAKVGQTDTAIAPTSGGTVQFKDVEISFGPQVLPSQVTAVTINTVPVQTLNVPPQNPMVGPIYQFRVSTTVGGVTTQTQNASFATAVPVQIVYDPTQIPAGLNEENLKPYYYDGLWGRWIPIKNAAVDTANHQISFYTTHFTDFSVQATQATEQTVEDLRNTKFSPFGTQIGQKAVTVSPEGGNVTTEFTELMLPGKNHFDLVIKRTYDSGLATVDATTGTYTTDGDYPWYMGQGWRLDFPWMKWNGSGLWIKGLDAQIISADQGTMTTVQNGGTVNATLEVHESNDVIFQALFTSANQYNNSSSTSYRFSSGKLLYKDGREVDYDSQGRVAQIVDSSGINSIQFTYNGNQAATIVDSLGRTVTFVNQTVGTGATGFTQISGIQLAAGTESLGGSKGPPGGKPIAYNYNAAGSRASLQLLSESDIQGRLWNYGYSQENILHQFQGAVANNYFDTVYALASVSGPGIGQTTLKYQHVPLLYSHSVLSGGTTTFNSSQVDDLQAASLSISGPSSGGSNVILKSSTFSFSKSDQVDFTVPYKQPVIFFGIDIFDIPETHTFTNSSLLQQYYTTQSIQRDYRGDQSISGSYPESTQTTNYGYVVKSRPIPSMSGALMGSGETDYQIVPYPADVTAVTVDGSTNVQTVTWDTNFMRVTQTVTKRSSSNFQDSNAVNSSETDLSYDNWGNITKSVSTTLIGGGSNVRQSVLEQDSSFYNVSGVASTSSWPGSPSVNDASFPRNQHSLLATQQTIVTGWTGTVPTPANQTVSSQFEFFSYTALGQLASDQKYTGAGWASTSYAYDSDDSSSSYGELVQTVGPTGQVTNTAYDFTSHPNEYWVTTTKVGIELGNGSKADLITRSAFDLLMGTCSWSQDARGFVAQQSYDALGRATKIIEPIDGESQPLTADISAWLLSANRSQNPTTRIVYDDTALSSTVTNPIGLKTFYQFNSLGQLTQIQKTSPAVSPLEPAGPEIVTSALVYGDGYNYTQPTHVIGPYSNMETDPNRNASSLVTNYSYDASGRTTSIQMPGAGKPKTVVYDDTHSTTTTTDETGRTEVLFLDWKQRVLAKTTFPDAVSTVTADTFYDGLGRQIGAIDPNGNLSLTVYNAFGLVSRQVAPTRSVQSIQQTPEVDKSYSLDGSLLQSFQVALTSGEKVASVNYTNVNGLGWPLQVQTPVTTVVLPSTVPSVAEVTVNTIYDVLGHKLQETSGYLGGTQVTKQWTYDSHGRVLNSIDELGHTTSYTYDLVGNRTSVTDPLGNSIALQYDSFNRLVKATLPPVQLGQSNPVIQFRYDGHGNLVQRVEADGVTHQYVYSLRNEVLTEAITNGTTSYITTHAYDDAGRQTSVSSPSGHTVNVVYDGAGRVKKQGNDTQGWTSFTYDSNGNKTTVTDGNGHVTTYQDYTPENKPQSLIDGNGNQSFVSYDRWGRQIQTQDGEQNFRTFQYDELGRVTSETTPTQGTLSYIYDAWGDTIQKTDARGTAFTQTYDAARRLTNQTALNGVQSQFVNLAYDNDNNLMTSDNGSVVTVINTINGAYQNNPYGLATQVTKTVGSATLSAGYSYDNRQRVIQVSNPDQSQVNYSYNSLGQLSSMPGWIDSPINYDSYGRLQDLTLDNGVKRTLGYDSQDRLSIMTYTASGTAVGSYTFTYDQVSNIAAKSVDGNTANQYTYDKINQLIGANEHGWFQQPVQSVQGSYGSVDNDYKGTAVLSFTVRPQDPVTLDTAARSFGVDLGSVLGISQIKLTPQSSAHRVRQRDLGVFVSNTNNPGDYTTVTGFKYVQNQNGVIVIQLADVVQARFVKVKTIWNDRDMNDVVTDQYASFKNTASVLFQVAVLKNTQNDAYTYDGNGNRISLNVDGTQQVLTYYKNAAGGNLSLLQSDGTWFYKYDPNGNMILKAKALVSGDNYNPGAGVWNSTCDITQDYWNYAWDLNNRLTSVSHNGVQTVSYLYDAAGLRTQRVGSDGTTVYMYSSNGTLLYSNNTTTGLARTITYMGSTIVGWVDTTAGSGGPVATRYYATTDHLGSVTKITDVNAKVVWQSEYTPFGTIAGAQGTYNFTGLFTGKDVDADTGLYYFNARWYDASTGRFISEDAAGQGLNWYSYGGNDPVNNTDPTGNDWGSFWSAVGVGVAAVAVAFIPVVGPYLSAAIIGGYMGGMAVNGGSLNIGNWKNDAQTWEGIGAGAVIGVASAFAGAAVLSSLGAAGSGAALSSSYALDTGLAGAASGFVGGFGNAWAFGDMKDGLFHGGLEQDFEAGAFGAVAGFAAGYLVGALAHSAAVDAQVKFEVQHQLDNQYFPNDDSFRLNPPTTSGGSGLSAANPEFDPTNPTQRINLLVGGSEEGEGEVDPVTGAIREAEGRDAETGLPELNLRTDSSALSLSRGSTGRFEPFSLPEQLAMQQARANPGAGFRLPIQLNDPRWPAIEGWVKMQQNFNTSIGRIVIHYVLNFGTGESDDFKFVELNQ